MFIIKHNGYIKQFGEKSVLELERNKNTMFSSDVEPSTSYEGS